MNIDFGGKAVLINGSASSIGLHIALAFARRGAACILVGGGEATDEAGVLQRFAEAGAVAPMLAKIGAAHGEEGEKLLREVQARHESIEAFIHVPPEFAAQTAPRELAEYSRQEFLAAMENRAWPVVEYTRAIHRVFGSYPRYVIGVAGASTLEYSGGADFTAASESSMETLCRYLNAQLFEADVRVNLLRYRNVSSASSAMKESAQRFTPPEYFVAPEEVAGAAVALCSGLMDCMSGHVLTVDRGTGFFDNLMRLYTEREQYQLERH